LEAVLLLFLGESSLGIEDDRNKREKGCGNELAITMVAKKRTSSA